MSIALSELAKKALRGLLENAPSNPSQKIHQSWLNENQADPRWALLAYEKYKTQLQLAEFFKVSSVSYHEDENPLIPFRNFERASFSSETKVPLLDITTSRRVALWALLSIVMVVSTLLREATSRLSTTALAELEESWIVLDARTTLGTSLGVIWAFMILIAPLIPMAALLLSSVLRVIASDMTVWGLATTVAVVGMLGGVSMYCSSYAFRELRDARVASSAK